MCKLTGGRIYRSVAGRLNLTGTCCVSMLAEMKNPARV